MKFTVKVLALAVLMAPAFVLAQEAATPAAPAPAAAATQAAPAAAPAAAEAAVTPKQAEASVAVSVQDQKIVEAIDADEKIQEIFDAFMERKRADQNAGITDWGEPSASGVIYFCEMSPVSSKASADPEFLKKRQTAFTRAFMDIRNSFVKYSFRSQMESTESASFSRDANAARDIPKSETDAVKRISEKVVALAESEVDRKLQENGVDPSKFNGVAQKRVALSQSIVRTCAAKSYGSCAGLSVVKTVEGRGTDGQYSIGVIAKYDPLSVVIANAMARKVRPDVEPRAGFAVGELLKGDMTQNFGTRLYYDAEGNPCLLSFGQWTAGEKSADRFERKLLEKSAFQQAEAQANIDMGNFLAGSMTYKETAVAGEEFAKTMQFDADGRFIGFEKNTGVTDYVNWESRTSAVTSLAGRSVVYRRMLKHPDTSAPLAVVAVNWTFRKIDQLTRQEELARRPSARRSAAPAAAVKPASPVGATAREGATYDF